MEDEMRDELHRYFERDIGRPPGGARERVLSALSEVTPVRPRAAVRPRRSRPFRWLAGSAAAALVVLAGVSLVLARIGDQPAGPPRAPSPPIGGTVAYDAARGVLVVFGDSIIGGRVAGDTWTWNGQRWTQRHPSTTPPPIGIASMTFDARSGNVVLYSSSGASWTWDGGAWSRRAAAPKATGRSTMAFDPASGTVLLYTTAAGGHEMWRWDGARWSQLQPATLPGVDAAVMVWDGRQVLLVGTSPLRSSGQRVTETWAWDGITWSQLSPALRLAAGTYGAAYDQAHGGVVALVWAAAPQGSETWIWDGATWRRVQPAHQPLAGLDLVYDAALNRVVVYGGGGLWTWDGFDWTLAS